MASSGSFEMSLLYLFTFGCFTSTEASGRALLALFRYVGTSFRRNSNESSVFGSQQIQQALYRMD